MSNPSNPRQLVADGYNVLAQPYLDWSKNPDGGGNGGKDTPLERHFDHFLSLLAQKSGGNHHLQVLELGCGAGIPWTSRVSKALAKTGQLTATDISHSQIELATKHLLQSDPAHSNVTLLLRDAMDLEFEPNQLDAVYAIFSLIHLPQHDQEIILKRIATWLKPDGLMFMNFSAQPQSSEDTNVWLDGKTTMYWSALGLSRYDQVLAEVGLTVVVRDVAIVIEDGREISFVFYIVKTM
ncbi:S-adenosyl-L-methionine-dependent methyltransferase [Umbelopsis sp. PMI_123]|nr:S-adenosyl-L-methionine-dependent methyltransferase [Umbelopsis sp. PMI_123]